MTILFVGSEEEAFDLVGASLISFSTSAGIYQSEYSRGAITVNGTSWIQRSFTAQTDIWVHFNSAVHDGATNAAHAWCRLIDSATGEDRISVYDTGSGGTHLLNVRYWNGSSYTITPTILVPTSSSNYDIDLHVIIAAFGGAIELYVDGILIYSFSGNTSAIATSFNIVQFHGNSGVGSYQAYSQVIVSTTMTVGMKVATLAITGAGTTSQWGGAYTDISETVLSDATFISDNVNGEISTYPVTDIPTSGNYNIGALVVSARAERGATGVQNLALGVRSGGANYWGSPVSGLVTAFGPVQNILTVDPATGIAWTTSGANAVEVGVQAQT